MKKYSFLMFAAAALMMASCSNDDEPKNPNDKPEQPAVSDGAYVLNQGSYYSMIEGSLSLLSYDTKTASNLLFQKANGRSLGSTPQAAVVYGSKIYIGVYESNTIEIIDRYSYKSVKQISLASAQGQSPRSLVAHDGKVYISMYNGYVSRLDTLALDIDKTVKVGPNPEIMAVKGKYLYVPNSDGMNWEVGYGTTASKIDLTSFTVEKTFTVGLNPAEFVTNGTDLFLLCKGDYGATASKIYRIDDSENSTEVVDATLLSIKDSNLYYINAPYGATEITYGIYNIGTKTTSQMVREGVESPAGLGVDPITGNIVITSYALEYGYASYNTDGYAHVYDASGNLLGKYAVGVGPVCIFFNHK